MRFALVLVVASACSEPTEPTDTPDALEVTDDATPADAAPDFFGEPCDLPMIPGYPGAISTCHDEQGFCVDLNSDGAGECRPWCDVIGSFNATYTCIGAQHGGVPTWTSDGTTTDKPFVCVCEPPR